MQCLGWTCGGRPPPASPTLPACLRLYVDARHAFQTLSLHAPCNVRCCSEPTEPAVAVTGHPNQRRAQYGSSQAAVLGVPRIPAMPVTSRSSDRRPIAVCLGSARGAVTRMRTCTPRGARGRPATLPLRMPCAPAPANACTCAGVWAEGPAPDDVQLVAHNPVRRLGGHSHCAGGVGCCPKGGTGLLWGCLLCCAGRSAALQGPLSADNPPTHARVPTHPPAACMHARARIFALPIWTMLLHSLLCTSMHTDRQSA